MLSGKKTYLTAAVIAGLTFAKMMGWIDAAAYDTVLGLLAALGLTFARVGTVKG